MTVNTEFNKEENMTENTETTVDTAPKKGGKKGKIKLTDAEQNAIKEENLAKKKEAKESLPKPLSSDKPQLYRFVAKKFETRANLCISQPREKRSTKVGSEKYLPAHATKVTKPVDHKVECSKTVPFKWRGDDQIPYCPASTLKGTLRNIAVNICTRGQNNLLSDATVGMLTVGGDIGKVQMNLSFEEKMAIVQYHPLLQLFGYCYPIFGQGFLSFHDADTTKEFILNEIPVVRKNWVDNPEYADLLTDEALYDAEQTAIEHADNSTEKKAIEAELTEISKKLKDASAAQKIALEDEQKKLRAEQEELKTVINNAQIHTAWAIPPKVEFSHLFSNTMTMVELGLMLRTLRKWGSMGGTIGGKKASGAGGDIEFDYRVDQYDHLTDKWCKVGNITNVVSEDHQEDDCETTINGDLLNDAVDAFNSVFDEIQNINLKLDNFVNGGVLVRAPKTGKKTGE